MLLLLPIYRSGDTAVQPLNWSTVLSVSVFRLSPAVLGGTIGNYNNSAPETLVKLPFKPSVVKDLWAGKTISAGQNFKFNVPRSDIRLFYLKK